MLEPNAESGAQVSLRLRKERISQISLPAYNAGCVFRRPPVLRPVLVLVFGLATTWLDYELNLSNDLARNLKDVEAQAECHGHAAGAGGARINSSAGSRCCWRKIWPRGRMSRG